MTLKSLYIDTQGLSQSTDKDEYAKLKYSIHSVSVDVNGLPAGYFCFYGGGNYSVTIDPTHYKLSYYLMPGPDEYSKSVYLKITTLPEA